MEGNLEQFDDDLTPEELEANAAEALPERAAMSTLNLTSLDAAGGTVEAVADHAVGAGDQAAAEQPASAETAPQAAATDSPTTASRRPGPPARGHKPPPRAHPPPRSGP